MITDVLEALVRYSQNNLAKEALLTEDKTLIISCAKLLKEWQPGKYELGDIRTDGKTPYECILSHDSIENPDWDISVRTLWKPYHSRKLQWALPWQQPSGSYDIYTAGEYMIWKDGNTYLCKEDTSFNPEEYTFAWEKV